MSLADARAKGAYTPVASASTLAPYTPGSSAASSFRNSTTNGVATGQIGAAYGPYSYPQPNRDSVLSANSRFSNAASNFPDNPLLRRANTTTVSPQMWDLGPEPDDALHNPARDDSSFTLFSLRGWVNASALFVLLFGLIALFAGYPIISGLSGTHTSLSGAFNLGGINSTGQVPALTNFPSLIDADTPSDAYSRTGITDGKKYKLVFSDEFNTDGRTFFPGDDPYWTAVDLHYWPTADLEWYDPSAITTQDGNLVITMTETPNHDLNFMSGMLQSWNQLCFTTGYIEVSVSLPGTSKTAGFWPGVWTMGNLGRAGYGASTEGMWPYTYDSCDVGTLPNQTAKDGTPAAAATGGSGDSELSFLPGQRVSACTCPGGDHPGPSVSVGRGVPEMDIIEAQIDTSVFRGQVSQSFQVAPFNLKYDFDNSTSAATFQDSDLTKFNSYKGSQTQQALSALTYIPDNVYSGQDFGVYGIEYWSDPDNREDGYITWVSNGQKSWSINADAAGPDSGAGISQRIIPEEPMSIILNLGMSPGFQRQDFMHMTFPEQDAHRLCAGVPARRYINDHINAYTNPNLTIWSDAGYQFPKNSLWDGYLYDLTIIRIMDLLYTLM
ncbi:glycoside hydrolase family 16 protein [Roridomyces roridus]|uniref:Glycoside hydrolase family 16 protein n=1 Tax=Roridomyces roridus TaxID=1738132 RepID=A0AAD7CBU8_9AGAR|nr:glycoside hydrolase family 16 protein [Roridomyces roridus]